jgi:catechol 2,3-dioxygenase-like lactoylglutathione lyase family enzyme
MKYICALLIVEDINRSRNFYEKVMRQKVKFDFGENVTFESGFAIHLKSHYVSLIDDKPVSTAGHSFELYFEYDNLDSFVKELRKNNIEFVHQIREQPWRQKVIRFYDPDKHIIEVGESMEFLSFRLLKEGRSIAEISKITNMPVDFVINSVNKKKRGRRSV